MISYDGTCLQVKLHTASHKGLLPGAMDVAGMLDLTCFILFVSGAFGGGLQAVGTEKPGIERYGT